MTMIHPGNRVVIVGAGCFGLSTAYHLLRRGFTDVTVLDRSSTLPAPDAASNDYNRIVRSSYDDLFYTTLCREAILSFKDVNEWGDTYHESGVLILGTDPGSYSDAAYHNDLAVGASLQVLSTNDAIHGVFPPEARVASFSERVAYLNHDAGWANAAQGTSIMTMKVIELKGKVVAGRDVCKLIRGDGKTTGVQCRDGTIFDASLVVIATGSWTASSFREMDFKKSFLATGQCVAMIQLTEAEAEMYRACPVVLDFRTGFYVFPPNTENIMKMAIHAPGSSHTIEEVSTPRTVTSDTLGGLRIPKSALQEMRARLREVYPSLSEKPFSGTRLCWYNDSPDGDWVIGSYPEDPSVVLATAGSGHAYKFMPVIGRIVADYIQGTLDPSLVKKFAVNREHTHADESRMGQVSELNLEQLCSETDLLPDVPAR